jgi:Ca2+-binding EF-hand superfamily protein
MSDTENKIKQVLKNLFKSISESEVKIEEQRQVLAALEDFDPTVTFFSIDIESKGYITPNQIFTYMKNSGSTDVTEKELEMLVKYFDSLQSDKLNLDDYVQVLLPCSNDYLRTVASNRRLTGSAVSKEVSTQLRKLFEKECEFHRTILKTKTEIAEFKMDPLSIFKMIDTGNKGYLDGPAIDSFLRSLEYSPSKTDLNSIIRRFDVTADARISFNEFVEGIMVSVPQSTLNYSQTNTLNGYSNLRTNHHQNTSNNMSYGGNTDARLYTNGNYSPNRPSMYTPASVQQRENFPSSGYSEKRPDKNHYDHKISNGNMQSYQSHPLYQGFGMPEKYNGSPRLSTNINHGSVVKDPMRQSVSYQIPPLDLARNVNHESSPHRHESDENKYSMSGNFGSYNHNKVHSYNNAIEPFRSKHNDVNYLQGNHSQAEFKTNSIHENYSNLDPSHNLKIGGSCNHSSNTRNYTKDTNAHTYQSKEYPVFPGGYKHVSPSAQGSRHPPQYDQDRKVSPNNKPDYNSHYQSSSSRYNQPRDLNRPTLPRNGELGKYDTIQKYAAENKSYQTNEFKVNPIYNSISRPIEAANLQRTPPRASGYNREFDSHLNKNNQMKRSKSSYGHDRNSNTLNRGPGLHTSPPRMNQEPRFMQQMNEFQNLTQKQSITSEDIRDKYRNTKNYQGTEYNPLGKDKYSGPPAHLNGRPRNSPIRMDKPRGYTAPSGIGSQPINDFGRSRPNEPYMPMSRAPQPMMGRDRLGAMPSSGMDRARPNGISPSGMDRARPSGPPPHVSSYDYNRPMPNSGSSQSYPSQQSRVPPAQSRGIANMASSNRPPITTPSKPAPQQTKGAFNMMLSPEIKTNTGGWSFKPSPDANRKDHSANKRQMLDGIQKGPLRI